MADDIFTNLDYLEYPLLEDEVDVRVLNNNTRLLASQQFDTSVLDGIAKETSPYKIENAILDLKSQNNEVSNTLDDIAKETSPYKIENAISDIKGQNIDLSDALGLAAKETSSYKIENEVLSLKTQNTQISNILSDVAKETDPYFIEEKIKDLYNLCNSLKGNQKWWTLPDIYGRKVFLCHATSSIQYTSLTEVYKLTGSGKLISISFPLLFYVRSNQTLTVQFQLLVDDAIIMNQQIQITGATSNDEYFNVGFGIHNIQADNPYKNQNSDIAYSLSKIDETASTSDSVATAAYRQYSKNNTPINDIPYNRNIENNYMTSVDLSSTLQTHNIGTYSQQTSAGVSTLNSYIHFYDDTCINFSKNISCKFMLNLGTALLINRSTTIDIGLAK